jgi:hypothetical protein
MQRFTIDSYSIEGQFIEYGFKFDFSSDVDGFLRRIGTAPNGVCSLELIGMGDDLRKVTLLAFLPNDSPSAVTENTLYMLALIKTMMPEWNSSGDWFTEQVKAAIAQEGDAETSSITQGEVRLTLSVMKSLGAVMLAFVPASSGMVASRDELLPVATEMLATVPVVTETAVAVEATANTNAKLRSGPGTNYDQVGSASVGTVLQIVARTEAGDWYQLAGGAWVFGELVDNAPVVAVAANIPMPPVVAAESPATAAPVPAQPTTFGAGMKIVGVEISPGTYRSLGGGSCYWERLSGFGGTLDEIIANDNAAGPSVVTIAATDKGFNSVRCGRWTQDLSPVLSSPTAPFGDGTFIVNKDIAPGTWRSSGDQACYWERLNDFSGELNAIIANDNTSDPTIVTIGSGDAGFSSKRCGTWTKVD